MVVKKIVCDWYRSPGAQLRNDKLLWIVYDVFTPHVDRDTTAKDNKGLIKVNLVFLHGSGMNRSIWEYYVDRLHLDNEKFVWGKILTLDMVNHGDSGVLNRHNLGVNFNWIDGARDASMIAMKEFNVIDGNINGSTNQINIVIGHSMGGFQAITCNILYPNLFQLVIVMEPVVISHDMPKEPLQHTRIPQTFFKLLLSKMRDTFPNKSEYIKYMQTESFYKDAHPTILERLIDFEKLVEGDHIRTKMDKRQNSLCYLTLNPSGQWLIANLDFLTTPVYCIVGGKSTWTPKANNDTMQEKIQDFQLESVKDGGHLINLENPDECVNLINDKLNNFIATYQTDASFVEKSENCTDNNDFDSLFNDEYAALLQERVVSNMKSRRSKL